MKVTRPAGYANFGLILRYARLKYRRGHSIAHVDMSNNPFSIYLKKEVRKRLNLDTKNC